MTNKPHSVFVTYIGRPRNSDEPDLLVGYESEPLTAKTIDDSVIDSISIKAPDGGWSHDQIEAICDNPFSVAAVTHTIDLFLADRFIGSTEI